MLASAFDHTNASVEIRDGPQGGKRVMFSHLSRELRDLRVSVVNSEFPLRVLDERSSLVEVSKSGPFP